VLFNTFLQLAYGSESGVVNIVAVRVLCSVENSDL